MKRADLVSVTEMNKKEAKTTLASEKDQVESRSSNKTQEPELYQRN